MTEQVKVTTTGDIVKVVMRAEVGGGLWRRLEKRSEISQDKEIIGMEIVGEVNRIRDDGEEFVRLISCGKKLIMADGRSDLEIEGELTRIGRKLSKPEIRRLFEIGLKRFLKKPEINPMDLLGPRS